MDIQQLLAALFGQGGAQGAPQMGAPTQVGDHNNPALQMQQRLAQPPQMAQQVPQQPMPPQAPQGQPMPQPAPQAAPAPQGGGLGAIGGILQNIIAPQSAQKNKTVGWLTSQGLDQGTATVLASDKGALRSYILSRSQGKESEFDQRARAAAQYKLDPASPEGRNYILTGKLGSEGDGKTRTLSEQEVSSLKLTPGSYQMDSNGKITSIGGVREQDPTFGREKDLRQEYENNPNVKNYQIVRDNYERIRQGATIGSGAGDLAIVFGYMKMLDPTSVVREGEQASAENTAGVPAAIRNTYNRLMSGDKLSPEARQQLLDAANQVYTQSAQNLGDLNKRYSGIASNYQLDPARIVQMPETYDPLAPPPQTNGDLPLPPPEQPAVGAPGGPAAATPGGQRVIQQMTNPAPVKDWKDYFGKKAR